MKLAYLYLPVSDVDAAVAFHLDQLGLEEAWREDDGTVAVWLPDRSAQIMIGSDELPAGPMYEVDDVDAWVADHAGIEIEVERFEIPGGAVVGLSGPAEHVFYVFDMAVA